ncbi:hypothetical protein [Streptomyces acidicola]|uniref:Uncharacterized protein n=1 Tax=Streptomyces acidicola TaxID=2596892 RepID=A0A5N8X678_9ACTN|nr:hypothetical protein [Streptomyces acidicola]MPY54892.1 hypothetical protein [Streptomyces acidicola]
MCHQHSPCANDSPNPYEEKFFISNIINTPRTICLQTAHRPYAAFAPPARRDDDADVVMVAVSGMALAALRRAACTCGEAAGLCAALLDAASRAPSEEWPALRLA